jgi:hypothetical protein
MPCVIRTTRRDLRGAPESRSSEIVQHRRIRPVGQQQAAVDDDGGARDMGEQSAPAPWQDPSPAPTTASAAARSEARAAARFLPGDPRGPGAEATSARAADGLRSRSKSREASGRPVADLLNFKRHRPPCRSRSNITARLFCDIDPGREGGGKCGSETCSSLVRWLRSLQ